MSTSLYILTNAKFDLTENQEYFDNIQKKLQAIPLVRASYYRKGKFVTEDGDWNYEIQQEDDEGLDYFSIWFNGPYAYSPILFPNICYISTIYRYSTLYQVKEHDWLDSFRKDIYNIIKAVGGTEVIFVADNACDKLDGYLSMAFENNSYETIKAEMLKEFGEPVTDYAKLDYSKLDYNNITEFFFDDFKDLSKKETYEKGFKLDEKYK